MSATKTNRCRGSRSAANSRHRKACTTLFGISIFKINEKSRCLLILLNHQGQVQCQRVSCPQEGPGCPWLQPPRWSRSSQTLTEGLRKWMNLSVLQKFRLCYPRPKAKDPKSLLIDQKVSLKRKAQKRVRSL